mmetsp:Transcript_25020/g.80650  ORF Transcript_25020/g.80650 Transcript_25020/m.80650 type:complete len:213 (-) Transcript_25020:779-1417(-)
MLSCGPSDTVNADVDGVSAIPASPCDGKRRMPKYASCGATGGVGSGSTSGVSRTCDAGGGGGANCGVGGIGGGVSGPMSFGPAWMFWRALCSGATTGTVAGTSPGTIHAGGAAASDSPSIIPVFGSTGVFPASGLAASAAAMPSGAGLDAPAGTYRVDSRTTGTNPTSRGLLSLLCSCTDCSANRIERAPRSPACACRACSWCARTPSARRR